jgi:catechol 2,3-dioxygenase-like lactoylglutathione lyase family enzyme
MSIGVVAIDHAQITAPRALEKECVAFYRKLFRAAEIAKPASLRARGGAWFMLGAVQFHIGLDEDASPPSRRHVCFLVEKLEDALAWAEANAVSVESGGEADGLRRFFIRDPAGNRIEIAQR